MIGDQSPIGNDPPNNEQGAQPVGMLNPFDLSQRSFVTAADQQHASAEFEAVELTDDFDGVSLS